MAAKAAWRQAGLARGAKPGGAGRDTEIISSIVYYLVPNLKDLRGTLIKLISKTYSYKGEVRD